MQSQNNKSCLAVFALCSLKFRLEQKFCACTMKATHTRTHTLPFPYPPHTHAHPFGTPARCRLLHLTHRTLSKQSLFLLLFHSRAKVKCVIYKSVWGGGGRGKTANANSRILSTTHFPPEPTTTATHNNNNKTTTVVQQEESAARNETEPPNEKLAQWTFACVKSSANGQIRTTAKVKTKLVRCMPKKMEF